MPYSPLRRWLVIATALLPMASWAGQSNTFSAELGGAEVVTTVQVPSANGSPVSLPAGPLVTGGHGKARFTLSQDGAMVSYVLTAADTATPITMAHIHLGSEGANGPIMLWLFNNLVEGAPLPLQGPFPGRVEGTLSAEDFSPVTDGDGNVLVETFDEAVANIRRGNAYVMVHTEAHPPGEIRGQIDSGRHHGHGPNRGVAPNFPFGGNGPPFGPGRQP